MSFCFIILKYTKNELHTKLLINCIDSIREIYKEEQIIIIDDYSEIEFLRIPEKYNNDTNIKIVTSISKNSGEINGYIYFNSSIDEYKYAVIMHDSMILKKKFDFEFNFNIKFLWHFEKNKWDDDKEIKNLIMKLPKNKNNIVYTRYLNKNTWYGCFGIASIISKEYLKKINNETEFLKLAYVIKNRPNRMALERVFAVINFMYDNKLERKNCSINGNIHKHPLCWGRLDDYELEYIKYIYKEYDSYMIKTWNQR